MAVGGARADPGGDVERGGRRSRAACPIALLPRRAADPSML